MEDNPSFGNEQAAPNERASKNYATNENNEQIDEEDEISEDSSDEEAVARQKERQRKRLIAKNTALQDNSIGHRERTESKDKNFEN